MVEVETRKLEVGARNIDDIIQKNLHPKPTWADLGDDRLNFYLAWSEEIVASAKKELETLRSAVYKDSTSYDLDALRSQIFATVNNARNKGGEQLIIIRNDINSKESRALNTLEQRNEKPKLADSELSQRWGAITRLLDSLPSSGVINAMKSESSDTTSKYLIRTRDGLLYIQSKNLPQTTYYSMIAETAGIFENDIQAAALEINKALAQKEAMVAAWRGFTYATDALSVIGDSIFRPPFQSPIRAQEQRDGSINMTFPNMESFREWTRTPRI